MNSKEIFGPWAQRSVLDTPPFLYPDLLGNKSTERLLRAFVEWRKRGVLIIINAILFQKALEPVFPADEDGMAGILQNCLLGY